MTVFGRAKPVERPDPERCQACGAMPPVALNRVQVDGAGEVWACTDPYTCRLRAEKIGVYLT